MVAEVLQQLLLKISKFLDKKKEVAKQPLLISFKREINLRLKKDLIQL